MELTLDLILSQLIAYLLYILALAGVVQTVINTLKPQFITPIRDRLEAEGRGDWYLFVFYIARIIVTGFGFFGVWGGVDAAREFLPAFEFIPDYGVAFGTIFLTVMGQEIIHPLIDRLYTFKDAAGMLEIDLTETVTRFDEDETSSSIASGNSRAQPLG